MRAAWKDVLIDVLGFVLVIVRFVIVVMLVMTSPLYLFMHLFCYCLSRCCLMFLSKHLFAPPSSKFFSLYNRLWRNEKFEQREQVQLESCCVIITVMQ